MSKLQTRLTYIKRCGYCDNEETYVMRDTNVNTGITDADAIRMAVQHVGDTEGATCESCNKFTQFTTVAYNLPEEA